MEKTKKYIKYLNEIYSFELESIRNRDIFINSRIKRRDLSLWKQVVLLDIVQNEIEMKQMFQKLKKKLLDDDDVDVYSENDREKLTNEIYDMGEFEFGTNGLGIVGNDAEILYSPSRVLMEIEKFLITDIAKIVVSYITKEIM